MHTRGWLMYALTVAAGLGVAGAAQGQPSYDFDFATVGAVNNAAFTATNPPNPLVVGRGSVAYEYRISKLETTTGQWLEFVNTFANVAEPNPHWDRFGPSFWGAFDDLSFPGPGTRYGLRGVANAAQLPVAGISWRMSALYCNWLHNGKQATTESLLTGAYDTSTWGVMPGTNGRGITDAPTHLPGALFWIPTLDEQLKAMDTGWKACATKTCRAHSPSSGVSAGAPTGWRGLRVGRASVVTGVLGVSTGASPGWARVPLPLKPTE